MGQSHFIKTVEDVYEAIVNTSAQIKFGIAFNEASGDCLTRVDGNDDDLKKNAVENAMAVGAGHAFIVSMREGFPINILTRIQQVSEVVDDFLRDGESGAGRCGRNGAGPGRAGCH